MHQKVPRRRGAGSRLGSPSPSWRPCSLGAGAQGRPSRLGRCPPCRRRQPPRPSRRRSRSPPRALSHRPAVRWSPRRHPAHRDLGACRRLHPRQRRLRGTDREDDHAPRLSHGHVAADGRVLVAGGLINDRLDGKVSASAELYDPSSGKWTATGRMTGGALGSHRHAAARWQGARGGRLRRRRRPAGLGRAV